MIWPFSRRPHAGLPEAAAERVAALNRKGKPDLSLPLGQTRWVVVDVETGGLNPHEDPLLSIGAVEINSSQINLGYAFERSLLQEAVTSNANILIHGLTHSQQLSGSDPAAALLDFAEFASGAVLVAFHAGFDRSSLQTAMKNVLGHDFSSPWLDAAVLAPMLFPESSRNHHLDDWLEKFGLHNFARHSAVADAVATAQLWLVLLNAAQNQKLASARDLGQLARARKWL